MQLLNGATDDTPNCMLYSGKEVKGLSLIRANWEAYIQNINACFSLIHANHHIISKVRDLDGEIHQCLRKLNLPEDFIFVHQQQHQGKFIKPSKLIRKELQTSEYLNWC